MTKEETTILEPLLVVVTEATIGLSITSMLFIAIFPYYIVYGGGKTTL